MACSDGDALDRVIADALRDGTDVPMLSADFGRRFLDSVGGRRSSKGDWWKIAALIAFSAAFVTMAAVIAIPRIMSVGSGERITLSMVPADLKRIEINGGDVTASSPSAKPLGDARVGLSGGGRLTVAPALPDRTAWTGQVDSLTYARGSNALEIRRGNGAVATLALGALAEDAFSRGTLVIAAGEGSSNLGQTERVMVPGRPQTALPDPRLVTRDLGKTDSPFYFLGYDSVRGFYRLAGKCAPTTIASDHELRESLCATNGLYIRTATNLTIAAGKSLQLVDDGTGRAVGVSIALPGDGTDGRLFGFSGGGKIDFGGTDGCFWAHARSPVWNVGAQFGRWVSFGTPICGKRSVTFAGYANDTREYVTYDLCGAGKECIGQWSGPTYVSGCRLQIGPLAWNAGLPWSDLYVCGGSGLRASQLQLAGGWGTLLRQNLHLSGRGPDGFFGGVVHVKGGSPTWTFGGSVELMDDALFFHDNRGCVISFRGSVYGPGKFIQGNGCACFHAENAYVGGTELADVGATVEVLTNATLGAGPVRVQAGTLRFVGGVKKVGEIDLAAGATLDLCGAELAVGKLSGNGTVTNSSGATATLIASDTTAFTGVVARAVRRFETIRRGRDWIPFENLRRIEPGSALDFSGEGFLDAPAGKYGRVLAVGGHFEFERRRGHPVRFNGVNLCNEAALPKDPKVADAALERFERLGYNTLRLHHFGNALVRGTPDRLSLNPEMIGRFDRFVAKAIARGFYLTVDLHSDRPVTWRDLGLQGEGTCAEFKNLVPLYEPAFSNWCGYARNLMTHVNPYTKRRYADEPALAFVCTVNEGHPLWTWDSATRKIAPVRALWRDWLRKRRAADPNYAKGVSEEATEVSGWGTPALQVFHGEMEARAFRREREFLRSLGCRALLTSQNCGDHLATLQKVRADEYDYVDDHLYTDHPKFTGAKMWGPPSVCRNLEPVNTGKVAAAVCAWTRVPGKPLCITEWSHSGPAPRRGAGGLVTGAMAATQDWDGLWHFDYSHTERGLAESPSGWPGYFSLAGDPIAQASDRAIACLFMRGDLPSAATRVQVTLSPDILEATRNFAWGIKPRWWREAWNAQVGVGTAVPDGWRAFPLASERWNRWAPLKIVPNPFVAADLQSGRFAVTTPRTVGGYLPGKGTLSAGPLTFVQAGAQPVTLWASTVGGREPIMRARRILLTHLTDAQGENTVFTDATHRELHRWGGGQTLLRAGCVEVSLALERAAACEVWAIDSTGRRRNRVANRVDEKGRLMFTANVEQPFGGCLGYEISKQAN